MAVSTRPGESINCMELEFLIHFGNRLFATSQSQLVNRQVNFQLRIQRTARWCCVSGREEVTAAGARIDLIAVRKRFTNLSVG